MLHYHCDRCGTPTPGLSQMVPSLNQTAGGPPWFVPDSWTYFTFGTVLCESCKAAFDGWLAAGVPTSYVTTGTDPAFSRAQHLAGAVEK